MKLCFIPFSFSGKEKLYFHCLFNLFCILTPDFCQNGIKQTYKAKFYTSIIMKNWKSLLVTVFSFFAISGMVLLNSCVKDPCTELSCKNGGSCSEGYCQCPTGFEGAECDITAASRFIGKWSGSTRCNNFPIQADTVTIELVKEPNEIVLKIGAGNTALLGFRGIAETPETHFVTYISPEVEVHAYITVDGGLLQLYLQTINKEINTRQNCYFSGARISYN